MKDTLVLKDNKVIELEAGASLGSMQVLAADRAAMVATWEQLTPDNLSAVQIKNGDGLTVGTYTDLVLVSETSTVGADGTILTSYHLREKKDMERLMERLAAVEGTLEVHDGAIGDMGAVISTVAESQEGGNV